MNAELKCHSIADEFEYYLTHQQEMLNKYDGRVIVLKDCQVIGDYDDVLSAITETEKRHKLGTFLIQEVSPGDSAYTATFYTPGMSV